MSEQFCKGDKVETFSGKIGHVIAYDEDNRVVFIKADNTNYFMPAEYLKRANTDNVVQLHG